MRVTLLTLVVFVLLAFGQTTHAQIKKTSINDNPHACGNLIVDIVRDPATKEIIGYRCQRYGIYPWFAAQSFQNSDGSWRKVWETQMTTMVGPSSTQGGVQADWVLNDSFNQSGTTGDGVFGGAYQRYSPVVGEFVPVQDMGTIRTDLFSASDCKFVSGSLVCTKTDKLAVGPLELVVNGYDEPTVYATTQQLKYSSYDEYGQVLSAVGVDPVYQDEATSKWLAPISESVPAKRGSGDAEFTTFAVVNYHLAPQSVLVTIRDESGKIVFSKSTPVLAAGKKWSFHEERTLSGGWYAAALSVGTDSFMGDAMFPPNVFGDTFVGTITFEGSVGGKIAPVVLNFKGKGALSNCKAKPIVESGILQ